MFNTPPISWKQAIRIIALIILDDLYCDRMKSARSRAYVCKHADLEQICSCKLCTYKSQKTQLLVKNDIRILYGTNI